MPQLLGDDFGFVRRLRGDIGAFDDDSDRIGQTRSVDPPWVGRSRLGV
ncbi:MAG: hypothetical protein ACE5LB_11445 [Acidiferrobacterales bacterium]